MRYAAAAQTKSNTAGIRHKRNSTPSSHSPALQKPPTHLPSHAEQRGCVVAHCGTKALRVVALRTLFVHFELLLLYGQVRRRVLTQRERAHNNNTMNAMNAGQDRTGQDTHTYT